MATSPRPPQPSGCLPLLLVAGLIAWAVFGKPAATVANWIWPYDAAPWETVTLAFYPDANYPQRAEEIPGLKSVQHCRTLAAAKAGLLTSPDHSGYMCFVGDFYMYGTLKAYRAAVR